MEGANRGPYARLIRLSNGHYRRVVDPVPPEFFRSCRACCSDQADTLNFDFITQETYTQDCTKFVSRGRSGTVGKKGRLHSDASGASLSPLPEPEPPELSRTSSNSTNQENSDGEELPQMEHDVQQLETNRDVMVVRTRTTLPSEYTRSDEGTFGINLNKICEDEGVPVLFYTKNRDKPTLMMLIIDQEMEVIYMKRNKASRFFPIKLIDKIVASPSRITEEFSRQIKNDPNTRIHNMVMFHASNFTDSVAIQFSDEATKEQFIGEISHIKDLIKNKF